VLPCAPEKDISGIATALGRHPRALQDSVAL
jgi:hypothetical protein